MFILFLVAVPFLVSYQAQSRIDNPMFKIKIQINLFQTGLAISYFSLKVNNALLYQDVTGEIWFSWNMELIT